MLGKIVHELIPSKENARNSEGAFITLKDGSIMFAYSKYQYGGHDHDPSDIFCVISRDGGESFGEPQKILLASEIGAHNLMSVSLCRMDNGDIGLWFLLKANVNTSDGSRFITKGTTNMTNEDFQKVTCIPYLIRSAGEGSTWSKPIRCIDKDGYFTVNNDRIIRLACGRLLMPAAELRFDAPYGTSGTICMYASDDDGYTWKRLAGDIKLPVKLWHEYGSFNECPMEPGVLQLQDGMIWCFIRTRLDRQYEMFSTDCGKTWSTPYPSRFGSSNSPMSAKRLSDGRLFALWNPLHRFMDREYKGQYIKFKWARTPLAYAFLAEDGGKFLAAGDLEDDRDRGFCYCAIHETDSGDLLLGYCAGSVFEDGDWLNRIRIRKILRSEIEELLSSQDN